MAATRKECFSHCRLNPMKLHGISKERTESMNSGEFLRWGLSVLMKGTCYSYKINFPLWGKFNPLWWTLSWIYLFFSYCLCVLFQLEDCFRIVSYLSSGMWIYVAIWKGSIWICTGASYVERCDSTPYHTLELSEGEETCPKCKYFMKLMCATHSLLTFMNMEILRR